MNLIDECVCGHKKKDHIYEEGACQPGFRCGSACEKFNSVLPMTDTIEEAAEEYANKMANKWLGTAIFKLTPEQIVKAASKEAFLAGPQWSRTETIREVLELLRSDDCDKFIGLTLSYYGGEDGPSIARWLAEKLGVKEGKDGRN